MKMNPYLIALGVVALIAVLVGLFMQTSLAAAGVGLALLGIGGFALVGWMVVCALQWERGR